MPRRTRSRIVSRFVAVPRKLATIDTRATSELHRIVSAPRGPQVRRASGALLVLIGLVLVGFLAQSVGISQLRHARDQSLLYDEFRYELANATAPVAQVDGDGTLTHIGEPVVRLSIPAIGVDEVVVEGTSSRTMLAGAGHRRDTVLPGQAGASVIFGRQSTYGAPFAGISALKPGERFTATTGQGTSTYEVEAVRREGDPQPLPVAAGEGRLTLVTADGPRFLPGGILRVDSRLVSSPFATPAPALLVGSLSGSEAAMGGDESGWLGLLLALEFAALATAAFTIAYRKWGRWHTWVVAAPVTFVTGCTIAEQVVVLLPNLY